jgi:putative tricarboxylic transport membrane protein
MDRTMNTNSSHAARGGRIAALVLLAFAIVFGIGGSRIQYAFSSDPLGPRVFPVALSIILAFLSVLYFLKPGEGEDWPRGATLAGAIAIPALVAATAILLEPLGFLAVIFMLTAGVGRVFGASWTKALAAGLVQAALWFAVFALLLEVYLPKGSIYGF